MLNIDKYQICIALLLIFTSCSTREPQYYYPEETSQNQEPELYQRARLDYQADRQDQRIEENREVEEEVGTDEQLNQYAMNWLYGQGMGKTLTNVGTVVIFPPYAFYVLGNAGLSVLGYEPLYITNILPETSRKPVLQVFNGVTSVPGRITAKVVGEEFQEPDE